MRQSERDMIKEKLKGLEAGTKIYVKDGDGIVQEAKFEKMNRTRFIAKYKNGTYSFPLRFFIGTCDDGINAEEIIKEQNKKYKKFNFIKKNLNIKGLNTTDCAIRGVAELLNISWEDAMIRLAQTSCITGEMPNAVTTTDMLLEKEGFKHIKVEKMRVVDFVENIAEKNKKYAIHANGHFTVVKGYDLIDSWDCRDNMIKSVLEMDSSNSHK